MIIYSSSGKYNIFEDYIISLINKDIGDEVKLWITNQTITIDNTHDIIIFMQVVPNHANEIIFKNTKKISIFVCNTEQLTNAYKQFIFNITPFIEHCKKHNCIFGICDYSLSNIKILKEHNDIIDLPIEYLPYQYSDEDTQYLKKLTRRKKVCTCGVMVDRRKKILKELEENDIYVDNAYGFREERDKNIADHKILLNISAFDNYTIFEHIRCDRLIFSGIVIISEYRHDYKELDISDFVIWCNKDKFVDKIYEVLINYDKYTNLEKEKKERIDKIIMNRINIFKEFRYKYSM